MPQAYQSYPSASRYTHQLEYNSSGEYDVFQTPTQTRYSQPVIYQPLYDTTIPQYYPIMAERSWSQTPDKGKRKREKAPTPVQVPVKTPKRSEERAAKRTKTAQLPTPPSTGREFTALPPHLQPIPEPPIERRGLKVLQSEEGRKLAVGQVLDDEVAPEPLPQRLAPAPAILTGENGVASLTLHPILESELAWLEDAGSPSPVPLVVDDEPKEKADKTNKRLQAFTVTARAEPMVCTKIDDFGRVAVRKDAALKFLQLESADLAEETKEDDEWIEAEASGSRIKPNWPDSWAAVKREDRERELLLKRYLEQSGDEDSDDEVYTAPGKGKGKSVARLIHPADADPRRRIHANADAKSALLTTLRYRSLPPLPVGVVACACGARSANGISAMVVCTNCQTWHHTICNGIDDMQLPNRWWCPNCENQVLNLSTPAQTPRRAYAQSEERSSAFKGSDNIALAPSPILPLVQTPANRGVASPTSRNHRSRILSYGTDMWAYGEEPGMLPTPSTPVPSDTRFTTPRIDDAPFDVTSTPSRHIDFNFGNPSLFSLTPLGRPRGPSNIMTDTPLTYRHRLTSQSDSMGARHDFLRDLAGPSTAPVSPATVRRGSTLLGASSIGSGHRRTLSGNKMSSIRNSSRSGLGLGMPIGAMDEEESPEEES